MGNLADTMAAAKAELSGAVNDARLSVSDAKEAILNQGKLRQNFSNIVTESRNQFLSGTPDPKAIMKEQDNVIYHVDGSISVRTHTGDILENVNPDQLNDVLNLEQQRYNDKKAGVEPGISDSIKGFLGIGADIAGSIVKGTTALVTDSPQTVNEAAEKNNFRHGLYKEGTNNPYQKVPDGAVDTYNAFMVRINKGEALSPADKAFANSPEFQQVDALAQSVVESEKKFTAVDKVVSAVKQYIPATTADDAATHLAFKRAAKEGGTVSAIFDMLSYDAPQLMKQGFESIPYMVAFTVGGPITQTGLLIALSKDKARENTTAFIANAGREPSNEELMQIKIWSTASTLAEKFGDMAFMKAIPFAKWGRAKNTLTAIDKLVPDSVKNIINKTGIISKPILGLVGEGISGASTEIADQMAVHGKITDTAEIGFAATAEALGVVGGGGGMVAANISLKAAKAILLDTSNSPDIKTTAKNILADIKTRLDSTDLITVGETPEGEPIQERINQVSDLIGLAEGEDTTGLQEEHAALTAQLLEPASGDASAAVKAQLEQQYNALKEAIDTDTSTIPTGTTGKPVEEAPADTTEIDETTFNADIANIPDAPEGDAMSAAIKEIKRLKQRALTEKQLAAVNVKRDALRAENNKQKAINAENVKQQAKTEDGSFSIIRSSEDVPDAVLDAADEAATTKANKAYIATMKKAKQLGKKLRGTDAAKIDTTMEEVGVETLKGTSDQWKGLDVYFAEINSAASELIANADSATAVRALETSLGKMKTHVGNINAKNKALRAAAAEAVDIGQPVYVRGTRIDPSNEANRAMQYIPEEMTHSEYLKARKNKEYVFEIDGRSGKLIAAIGVEAAYGREMYKLATDHKDTTFAEDAALKIRTRVSNDKGIAEILDQAENLAADEITDVDLAAIDNLEGTQDAPTTEAAIVKDTADSSTDISEEESFNRGEDTTTTPAPKVAEAPAKQAETTTAETTPEDKTGSKTQDKTVTPDSIFTDSDLGMMDNILGITEEDIQDYIDNPDKLAKAIKDLNETDVREDGADAQAEVDQELDFLNKIQKAVEGSVVKEAAAEDITESKAVYGADNTGVSISDYEKAVAEFNEISKRVHSGFDPKLVSLGLTMGGFHLEALMRQGGPSFANFSKKLIDRLGDAIRPLLVPLYNELRGTVRPTIAEAMTLEDELLEKYEVVPGGFANAEQRVAIDKVGDWLKDTASTIREYVIEGRGGTGKTAIVSKILANSALTEDQIAYTATTNKAAAILAYATQQETSTIWVALGIKPKDGESDLNENEIEEIEEGGEAQLEGVKLLIIDEASMIGENMIQEIEDRALTHGIKVLYLGDSAQLSPIRSKRESRLVKLSNVFAGWLQPVNYNSPVFNEELYPNRIKLLKSQRQNANSPILTLAALFTDVLDNTSLLKSSIGKYTAYVTPRIQALTEKLGREPKFWEESSIKFSGMLRAIPMHKEHRVTDFNVDTNSGVIFTGNTDSFAEGFVEDYLKNPQNTRIITAFNERNTNNDASVFNLNKDIFFRIFGKTRQFGLYEKGDMLMSYSTVKTDPKDPNAPALWNSSEYEVMSSQPASDMVFNPSSNTGGVAITLKIPAQTVNLKSLIDGTLVTMTVPAITNETTFPGVGFRGKPGTLQQAIAAEFAKVKDSLGDGSEAYEKFKLQNEHISKFGNIELQYAYAITAWKSQGSTYRNVYVLEDSLISIGGWSDGSPKISYQAMYVALSRPTDKLVMHSEKLNNDAKQVNTVTIDFDAQDKNVPIKEKAAPVVKEPVKEDKSVTAEPILRVYNGVTFTFVPKGDKALNLGENAVLAVTDGAGITMQQGITKEQLLAYLQSNVEDISQDATVIQVRVQKQIVTAYMLKEHNVDLIKIIKGMTDNQVKAFIIRHELSHVQHNHSQGYKTAEPTQLIAGEQADASNGFLADSAIKREVEANMDALRAMNLLPKAPVIPRKIGKKSKPKSLTLSDVLPTFDTAVNFLTETVPAQVIATAGSGLHFAGKSINALIKITKSRVGIFSIPSEAFADTKTLVEALVSIGLDQPAAEAYAKQYKLYDASYQKIVSSNKYIDDTGTTPAIRNPLRLLERFNSKKGLDGKTQPVGVGTLPPQAVFAMMIGVDNYMTQNGTDTRFQDDREKAEFMYGNGRSTLTSYDLAALEGLGLDYQAAVQDINRIVLSILGISASSTDTAVFTENLGNTLADMSMQVVDELANIPDSQVAVLKINTTRWYFGQTQEQVKASKDPDNSGEESRKFIQGQEYKHITYVGTQNAATRKADAKVTNEVVKVLTNGIENESNTTPLQEPARSVVSSIRGSFGDVPKKMQDVLRKLQDVAWGESETMPIVTALAADFIHVIHELQGVVKYDKGTDNKAYIAATKASNEDKINSLQAVLDEQKEGNLKKIYFKYRLQAQHRIMQMGLISPQNSHTTRHLLSPLGTTTYTKDNIHLFQYAVMFNMGYKVDKNVPVDISSTFFEYMEDTDVLEAIELLQAKTLNAEKFAEVVQKIHRKEVNGVQIFKGADVSLLTGLVSLATYQPYHAAWVKHIAAVNKAKLEGTELPIAPKMIFKSDVPLEVDGIANGFALNLLQFPVFRTQETLEKHLNQTGTYVGENTTHLVDGIYDPANNTTGEKIPTDPYLDLGSLVQAGKKWATALVYYDDKGWSPERIQALEANYKDRSDALDALYPDLADASARTRDLVKYPFMMYLYGAGIPSITRGVAKNVLAHLYQEMGTLRRDYLEDAEQGQQGIDTFAEHLNALGLPGTVIGEHIKKGTHRKFLFNEEVLFANITEILQPRFDYGLQEMLGDTKVLRDAVVQSGEIMHAVFMAHYDQAVADRVAELELPAGTQLSEAEIVSLVKKNLKKWLPQYKGPLADASVESFVGLSKRIGDRSDSGNTVDITVTNYKTDDKNKGKKTRNVSSITRNQIFTAPGVSSLIRDIINMDASLLALSLLETPDVLPLYDATFGRPELLMQIAETYNPNYLELGHKTSVSDIMRKQMEKVLNDTAAIDTKTGSDFMGAVETWIKDNAYVNKYRAKNDKIPLEVLRADVNSAANKVVKAKADLQQKELTSSQLLAQDMAATNPEAGKSVDAATAEIQTSLNIQNERVFSASKAVQAFPKAVQAAFTRMFGWYTSNEVANRLATYMPEFAADYVQIALQASDRSPKLMEAIAALEAAFPDENINAQKILVNMLKRAETSSSIINDYQNTLGEAKYEEFLQGVETELRQYEVAVDFAQQEAAADAEIQAIIASYNSLGELPRENAQTVFAKDITNKSLGALMQRFRNISRKYYESQEDMDYHTAVLDRVMSSLGKGLDGVSGIRMTVEQIDGMTHGNYNAVNKRVRVSLSRQVPGRRNEHSPQEVYAHELLHAMTVAALAGNALLGDQIRELRKQTQQHIDKQGGYKAFLVNVTGTPTKAEVKLAKEQYDYVFGAAAENVPEEFLAYAATNPAMIKATRGLETALPDRGTTPLGRLLHIIEIIADSFSRIILKKNKTNAHEEVLGILSQLIEIQTKHEGTADKIENRARDLFEASDKAIRKFVVDRTQQMINQTSTSKVADLSNAIIGGGILILGEGAARNEVATVVYSQLTGVAQAVASELGKGVLTLKLIKQLLFSKVNINKLFQQFERDTVRRLDDAWKSTAAKDISVATRKAITRVMYKTDLSSLLSIAMSPQQISKLLNNPDLIQKEIRDLIKATGLKSTDKAIMYARDLGYFMATKRRKMPQGHFNVHTIGLDYLNEKDLTADNMFRLDAIATLSALSEQSDADMALVGTLMNAELEADSTNNALRYILETHYAYVKKSRKTLFSNNPTQMQKGFTVDKIDDLTDAQTGLGDPATIKAMARKGYTHKYELGAIPGVKQAHTMLYVSRLMPENKHVSGILSTTGLHHSGTLLSDIIAKDKAFQTKDGKRDLVKIRNYINATHRKETQTAKNAVFNTNNENQRLSPIRDEQNNIVDYRVIMNNDSVEEIFQPNIEFQDVFAHMQSSYINKKNTISADKQTIDLLVDEWVRIEPSHKKQFTNILNADSPHHEKYRKLPQEVREYMQRYALNGEFLVRTDIIDKVFGYSAKNPGNIKFLQDEQLGWLKTFTQRSYAGLQEVMSFGMERIVMATMTVVAMNLLSNLAALTIRRISPRYTIKKIREGFQAYLRYEKDTQKLRDLHSKMEITSGAEHARLQTEFDAVQKEVNRNPIHAISSAGLHSSIVEGVNTASSKGYLGRMHQTLQQEKIVKYTDKMPTLVTDIAKNIVLHRDSSVYRAHKKVVVLTDLLGRYVMINHAVDVKGQSFDEALEDAIHAFVLFDENMHPWLEVINSMGFTAFLSYKLRNIRAVRNAIVRSPTAMGTAAGLEYLTGYEALGNASGPLGGHLLPAFPQQGNLLEAALTPAGPMNMEDFLQSINLID